MAGLSADGWAQTYSTYSAWTNPAGGDWANPANWYPGAIVPSGTDFSATLLAIGSTPYTVNLGSDANVGTLTISGKNTLLQTGGTLSTAYGTNIQYGTYVLSGGTLTGTMRVSDQLGQFVIDGTSPAASPTLNRAFIYGNVDMLPGSTVHARDILWVSQSDGTGSLGWSVGANSKVIFDGDTNFAAGVRFVQAGTFSMTVASGTVTSYSSFNLAGTTAGPSLTTIDGTQFDNHGIITVNSGASARFTNVINNTNGRISLNTPGSWVVLDNVDNRGVIDGNDGTVIFTGNWQNHASLAPNPYTYINFEFGGNFTTATLNSAGKTPRGWIAGTVDNTGNTLALNDVTGWTAWPLTTGIPGAGTTTVGTVVGGTVTSTTGSLVVPGQQTIPLSPYTTIQPGMGVFDGLTLDANLTISGGATLGLKNLVSLAPGRSISVGTATTQSGQAATLAVGQAATLAGSGVVVSFDAPTLSNFSNTIGGAGTLTIAPGAIVQTRAGGGTISAASVVNQGLITAPVAGTSLFLTSPNWSNQGTIEAKNGGNVYLGGGTAGSLGTLKASAGSRIYLFGTLSGVPVNLDATNNMTTVRNPLPGATGFATLAGSTVTTTGGATFRVSASSPSGLPTAAFDASTIAGSVTVDDQAQLLVRNGLTLQGGTISLTNNSTAANNPVVSRLTFEGGQAVTGTGTIAFAGSAAAGLSPSVVAADAGALTLGPGISVKTVTADGVLGGPASSVVNQGTVSSALPGRTILIGAASLANSGLLESSAGGTITVPATWSNAAGATFRATGAGSTLDVSGAGTNAGTLTAVNSGVVNLSGASTNSGAVSAASGGVVNVSGNWTNAGAVSASGSGVLNLVGAVTNTGTITVGPGGVANLMGALDNAGALTVSGGTLNFAGNHTSADFSAARYTLGGGSTVAVTGHLDNAGRTFAITPDTGSITVAAGGTVTGGTITRTGTATLLLANGGTLDGVTLDMDLATTAASAVTNVTAGLTVAQGRTFSLAGASSALRFTGPGAQSLAGPGSLTFDGASTSLSASAGTTLTIAPGMTVATGSAGGTIGAASAGTIVNLGTIAARSPGQTLTLAGNWSNAGQLELSAGTLNLGGSFTTSSLAGITQTGGTLSISGTLDNTNATFTLPGTTQLTAGATVTGGTIMPDPSTPGASLLSAVGSATLDGVSVRTDMSVSGGVLTLLNAQPLTGNTITVSSTLRLPGTQTLAGTGSVILRGILDSYYSGSLTIGPDVAIHADSTAFLGNPSYTNVPINNRGTISIAGAGRSLAISGYPFTNDGLTTADAGAFLSVRNLINSPTGTVAASGPSTLTITSTAATPWSNAGSVTVDGAAATFAGSWSNTGTVSVTNGGTLTLAGTSTALGAVSATNGTVVLKGVSPTAGTLNLIDSSLVVAAPYTTGQIRAAHITGPASAVSVAAGGILDNSADALTLSASGVPWRLTGGTVTGGSIASQDATPLVAASGSSTLASLTLAAPVNVLSGAALTLDAVNNTSTIFISSGGTLGVGATPAGSVVANPGSTLTLTGPTSTLSAATLTGATLNLRAAASTGEVRALAATGTNFVIGSGGTLNNAGDDLHFADPSNTWTLATAGTISGGTLGVPVLVPSGATSAALVGVSVASDLSLETGSSATATGSLALAGGRILLRGGTLTLAASTPFTGAGDVVFDSNASTLRTTGGVPLTIPAGVTVRTDNGTGSISASGPLTLQGIVSARTPGMSIQIAAPAWSNTGALEATNGGTLLLGGTFTTAGLGSLSTTAGGKARLTGTMTNSGATYTLSAAANVGLQGGTISGGVISSADSTPLAVAAGFTSTLFGTDVDAPIALEPSSTLVFNSATNRNAMTASGATLSLTGTWSNPPAGSISLSAASTLLVGGTLPASVGNISVKDSTVSLISPATTAKINAIVRDNAVLQVAGTTLTNTGATLVASDALGPIRLAGGTVTGGTLTTTGNARVLVASGTGSTLDGVTLQGNLVLSDGAKLTIATALTGATAGVSIAAGDAATTLSFATSQTFDGSADVAFDGTSSLGAISPAAGSTLTLGPAVTVRTGTQGGTVGQTGAGVVNKGLVSARTPGKTLTLIAPRNVGTFEAIDGGTLRITSSYSQSALPGTTTTGTINVRPYSTLLISGTYSNTGRTDLAGGVMIYDYPAFRTSTASTMRGVLANARTAGGNWSATTGLTSSVAAADPLQILAVGYAEASTLLGISGTATGTWSGQTVDATTLLLKITYYGDANLDGRVDADDYALLDRAFSKQQPINRWTDGDFNYSGTVDAADYQLADRSFLLTHVGSPASVALLAQRQAQFGDSYVSDLLSSTVPEPASLPLVVALWVSSSRRRRLTAKASGLIRR